MVKNISVLLFLVCAFAGVMLLLAALIGFTVGILSGLLSTDADQRWPVFIGGMVSGIVCGGLALALMKGALLVREVISVGSAVNLVLSLLLGTIGFASVISLGSLVARDEFEGSGQELLGAALFGPLCLLLALGCMIAFFTISIRLKRKNNISSESINS
ncbi:MAG: hypothetical protein SFY68_16010 [Candidatus Sumerlaeia bacterium]|nr:hypothetical protein [Candidatus Sumerlaeia bacterium]